MNVRAYSAICGNYDHPREDAFSGYDKFRRNVMNAKIYKLLPHKFLDDDVTIWLDGNITLNLSPEEIVNYFLGDSDMALFKHPERDCIYDEAPCAAGLYEDEKIRAEIFEQAEHYKKIGFPAHAGMGECNMLIRRNTQKVNAFNEAWWAETCRWSNRDQMSFPVVLSRFPELKVNFISGNVRKHPYFSYIEHEGPRTN